MDESSFIAPYGTSYRLPIYGVLGLLLVVGLWRLLFPHTLRGIPGPRGGPVVGIGLAQPSLKSLRNWTLQYGELYTFRLGWYNWVVLNSPEAIREVFDKQSAATSSKPPLPMGDDVLTAGRRMFTMPYGPKWRAFRTIIHQLLSPKMTQTFLPTQEFEVKQLLHDLAFENANNTEFYNHARRTSFSVIMTSTYGRRIGSWDHADVRYSGESSRLLGRLTASFVEDVFPPLMYLPQWLQPGRKRAEQNAEPILWAKLRLWDGMKQEIAAGRAPVCFGKGLMESDYANRGLTDQDAAWIAGGIVEAGSETTGVTLNNLILYLSATPAVQDAVQAELQAVVGNERPPNFEDLQSLPYVRACIKEVLRLRPVPVLGLKHFTDADVTYKDHVIPKGTVILANTAAVHFDEKRYAEPHAFKPERYLGYGRYSAEYAAVADPLKRDHFTFGAGRRICPGSRLAENTLELALANMLWAFDIRPPTTLVNGKERDMPVDVSENAFDQGAFRPARPFKARFVVRDEAKLGVVKNQWGQAMEEGYVLRGHTVDVNGVVRQGGGAD